MSYYSYDLQLLGLGHDAGIGIGTVNTFGKYFGSLLVHILENS